MGYLLPMFDGLPLLPVQVVFEGNGSVGEGDRFHARRNRMANASSHEENTALVALI